MTEDAKITASRPVEPVQVAVIGTGDGGHLPTGTEAVTPGQNQPNIVVNVVRPIFAIFVRFMNVFLPVFLGVLTGAMATDVIPASDFLHLALRCASLSVAGASVSALKDIITIFGKLEQKYPLLTGSI